MGRSQHYQASQRATVTFYNARNVLNCRVGKMNSSLFLMLCRQEEQDVSLELQQYKGKETERWITEVSISLESQG